MCRVHTLCHPKIWYCLQDALEFLIGFFKRYPELADQPFWIAGESYGGHYVPNLALAIHHHNRNSDRSQIPLKVSIKVRLA